VADPARRPRLLAEARQVRLATEGIAALAEASYPPGGEDAGYTLAIAFRATTGQAERILEVVREVL
jgi:hypothetical protein